jgi:hypothetical protein
LSAAAAFPAVGALAARRRRGAASFGSSPDAPATLREAGCAAKPCREFAIFAAVERTPDLVDVCRVAVVFAMRQRQQSRYQA